MLYDKPAREVKHRLYRFPEFSWAFKSVNYVIRYTNRFTFEIGIAVVHCINTFRSYRLYCAKLWDVISSYGEAVLFHNDLADLLADIFAVDVIIHVQT